MRRESLEEEYLDKNISIETYQRQHSKIEKELTVLENQRTELAENRDSNIDIFDKFMALTGDLHNTYQKAEPHLKQHLISLFFDEFTLKDKQITEVRHTKILQQLLENRSVIINNNWLQRLEAICRYFAFEKGAYCPNLRLEERLANKTDEWVM